MEGARTEAGNSWKIGWKTWREQTADQGDYFWRSTKELPDKCKPLGREVPPQGKKYFHCEKCVCVKNNRIKMVQIIFILKVKLLGEIGSIDDSINY